MRVPGSEFPEFLKPSPPLTCKLRRPAPYKGRSSGRSPEGFLVLTLLDAIETRPCVFSILHVALYC